MSFSNFVDANVFEVAQLLQFELFGGTIWTDCNETGCLLKITQPEMQFNYESAKHMMEKFGGAPKR